MDIHSKLEYIYMYKYIYYIGMYTYTCRFIYNTLYVWGIIYGWKRLERETSGGFSYAAGGVRMPPEAAMTSVGVYYVPRNITHY